MEEAQESRHFQISTAIFAAMLANPTGEHHQRRQSSSNKAPAVASHPVKPPPPLGIARRVDHPQQGLANGLHPGEFEDAAFRTAFSVCPEIPSVRSTLACHRDDDPRRTSSEQPLREAVLVVLEGAPPEDMARATATFGSADLYSENSPIYVDL